MIPLVVAGAAGRMGRAVVEAALSDGGFRLKACVDRAGRPSDWDPGPPWPPDLGEVLAAGEVVVEFTAPEGAVRIASLCAERGAALVSGTTGLSAAEEEAVRSAARAVPVLRAANFSLGLLALRRALPVLLSATRGWDAEIVERHHRSKQDSPSGTALVLAQEILSARGFPASALRHGRQGRLGPRSREEVGIHAVRGGGWVGDHAVLLAGPGEWIELRHVAQDRSAFAHGALAAAAFVAKAPAGFYTLEALVSAMSS